MEPATNPAEPHTAAPADSPILLVGNPNVGKSALFGRLTGMYVTVSNYPGTTVELTRASARLDGTRVEIVDTPGANSFLPTTDDERVTRDLLVQGGEQRVLAVGDAKSLERAVVLAVQLCEMQVPFALVLNMIDESRSLGIEIDVAGLEERLGVDVVPTIATTGEGVEMVASTLEGLRRGRLRVEYPEEVEHAVARIEPMLPATSIAPRALALMVLGGDPPLDEWLRSVVGAADFDTIALARAEAAAHHREPLSYLLNRTRLAAAHGITAAVRSRDEAPTAVGRVVERLDRATTHTLWGIPILAAVLYAAYQFVGVFGAGTLVGLLEEGLFGKFINPLSTRLIDAIVPFAWLRDALVGEYGVITMALTYSLALVLPIVGTFFVAFGVLEDSGYLPRLAIMVNRVMKRIGLNGKAVLPMVLGLGCDTMATLTTRILETRKERLIVILLLALGVPCSAQLTVILAILGALSPVAVMIWIGVVLGVLFLVGRMANAVLPGRGSDFVLEIPPLRVPRIKNILVKTLARIEWYLKEAVPLFVLGTLILFVADRLDVLGWLERAVEPVLGGLLGLPRETAATFIIGFLRRDFGAAGLYHMAETGALDAVQAVVAVVTITLFIPCIANFFMIVKERGWRTGVAISAFVFPFAIGVGALLNWALRAFEVPL